MSLPPACWRTMFGGNRIWRGRGGLLASAVATQWTAKNAVWDLPAHLSPNWQWVSLVIPKNWCLLLVGDDGTGWNLTVDHHGNGLAILQAELPCGGKKPKKRRGRTRHHHIDGSVPCYMLYTDTYTDINWILEYSGWLNHILIVCFFRSEYLWIPGHVSGHGFSQLAMFHQQQFIVLVV